MDKVKYQINGTISSSANLDVSVRFLNGSKIPKDIREKALAHVIDDAYRKMISDGTISMMTPTDISKVYGNTRQYWEKLINEGKIPYSETISGKKITTNIWVEGYISASTYNSYPKEVLEMRNRILENEQSPHKSRSVLCVRCNNTFSYYYNEGRNINGICDHCGFKLRTIK